MTCPEYKDLMMGYLDDELDRQQKNQFEQHLKSCKDCSAELQQFKKLKKITDSVALAEPEDVIWENYWSGVYNRLERGIGWIMMSIAGIALLIYCGFKAIEHLIEDPSISIALKITILAFIVGLAILFVSALREKLYFRKKDRYKNVRR
ncbi:MAG: zf-HC2 domain-containing protein [Phycisphaerae bacterium]